MNHPKPISVAMHPDEHWIVTLERTITDFSKALTFPAPLILRFIEGTKLACSELVHHCLEAGMNERFTLRVSYRDDACVAEITYNKNVPLDHVMAEADMEGKKTASVASDIHEEWLKHLKGKLDRIFFRFLGDRRVLEMRVYRRSEDHLGRHWVMGLKRRLRKDIKLDILRDDDGNPQSSVLHDMKSGRVLKMDAGGTFIVQKLDGAHTFWDIYMDYIDEISLRSPEYMAMVFLSLEGAGMLESDEPTAEKGRGLGRLSAAIRKLTFRSINIPRADRLVNGLYKGLSWLFHPVVMVLIVLFALSGFYPLSREISEIHHVISKPALAIYNRPLLLVVLYALMFLVGMLHELSHALTCRHYGGSVHRIGIMFYLAMIIFFADVSAAWGFRSKWKRIAVAAAGPLLNTVVMSACFWYWHLQTQAAHPEHSIWFLLGLFCLYSTVLNFIPFIKMDGYYMLTDLTAISTLREKSFAYLGQKLTGILGMGRGKKEIHPRGREKWILLSYGILGAAFTVLFFIYPIFEFIRYISAQHLAKGPIIFFGLIVALALYNAGRKAYRMTQSLLHREIVIA